MNILLDTNFVYALVDEADIHHKKATMIFLKEDHQLVIPYVVVTELLMSSFLDEDILATCNDINAAYLHGTSKELDMLTTFPKVMRRQLKANDCLLMALALTHQANIYSFDEKLLKAWRHIQSAY